ncbi:MAG: sigma-70 family RNA polymerase sigma factor [Verrucomicrobiales bacterium]|nr:sigma-70 family RNA polymerase sigma factor [Verrucomicrobiales bacterium]
MKDESTPSAFPETRWSLVLQAGQADPKAEVALNELCRQYWYPIYSFARRTGKSPSDAEDLTQTFFQRLLERDILERADRKKGKLRTFLLAAFKNVSSEEWKREKRLKRGGDKQIVSLELRDAEDRYLNEPISSDITPDQAYERSWALTLLDSVLTDLQEEFAKKGKGDHFEVLKEFLGGAPRDHSLGDAAEKLGLNEVATRVALHRIRKKYRQHLEDCIRETVGSEKDLEEEIGRLFAVFEK